MVTSETPNDTAFPLLDAGEVLATGLTKREFFAALAMQGLLTFSAGKDFKVHASDAVVMADELIKALSK